jgi:3-deoxy-D-manno-octulosonic-acid transferase
MPRWLYSTLLRGALPFAAVWFLWRGWRQPAYRGSLAQRLGFGLAPRAGRPLWLHAASMGEVQALAPLLRALHDEDAQRPLLLTLVTPTGLARARELFADLPRLALQAAPWDLPGATARFLDATRPRAGVFVETELWPNLAAAARTAGVPLILASARLSGRSAVRYQRWMPRLMRETVRSFARIGAQSEADATRFRELGAADADVTVTGNLKFDLQLPDDVAARGGLLRRQWAPARPLWIAGSTHAGEEAICVDAQRRLVAAAREHGATPPLLALAPRRPERFEPVARDLQSWGVTWVRSSVDRAPAADVEVLLVDELGTLVTWYAACDAAFVGGSLVPVGGHNLLEPALLAKPVLAGPHTFNAPQVAAALTGAGGLRVIVDAASLAAVLGVLLTDAAAAQAQGARASATAAAGRGALARTRELIAALPAR